ncbi:5-carboxymethyl-2-hydroxymuconate Delta-isomerase [Kordiimonas laminariae]|uniref:5-carboxymethyl-2-hydroxymuconate Delta-isomerase n=1 Tax=Kordiimonas laminariae TaxID=2917717 RepID=UPI001FF67F47|nr:5-carboxymethyl-2-hydroxymuconate Delta-isomerase [Kordiimonas laminariae]MCK0069926.1 5-carboxymethyl-2-hydroxymuconate Delta-isomerase [Kordiimonas laminariae]
MPHLVIEHSSDIAEGADVNTLMQTAHAGAVESGLFGLNDIKVRAYPCPQSLIGGEKNSFLHITIYLLSGRSQETKKALTTLVLDKFTKLGLDVSSLSVDARDMDREVYSKITR